MKKVLFAWTGNQDFKAAEQNSSSSLGAICMAATSREFDELVLLSDSAPDKTMRYREWLASKQVKNVNIIAIDLGGNPNDYKAIYEGAKRSVQDYLKHSKNKVELTFHLAPGTPAMATIWVILANSVFSAKLIHSSPERGVQDVNFPFDIAVDFLPDLLKKTENKFSATFSDHGPESAEFEAIIHRSTVMKKLVGRARIIAPHIVPVLIFGESGTGKELFARAIHNSSLRKGKPFIPINCGAIPVELFESELFGHIKGAFTGAGNSKDGYIKAAEGGTLFLDEIGELPINIQSKLLRVLQEKEFCPVGKSKAEPANIRVISATNRNLLDEISKGKFREDLYHRIALGVLHLPPLREREGDVGILIDHLMDAINKEYSVESIAYTIKKVSVAARSLLIKHSWPGNVRELENTLRRAAIWSNGSVIDAQDIELPVAEEFRNADTILGRPLQGEFDLHKVISEVAEHYLERALRESGGNKAKAAESLKFKSYQAMDVWLKRYGIEWRKLTC